MTKNKHIFITGQARSGTSLLRAIIGSHSEIGMFPYEFPFWTDYYDRYQNKAISKKESIRLIHEMLNNFTVKNSDVNFNPSALINKLNNHNTIGDIYELFSQHYLDLREKSIFGLKIPNAADRCSPIIKEFTNLKIIVIIRNPLKQSNSLRKAKSKWFGGRNNHYVNIVNWSKSYNQAIRLSKKHPSQLLVVKFEDLLTKKEDATNLICHFLGIKFEPSMLQAKDMFGWKGSNSSFKDSNHEKLDEDHSKLYLRFLCNEMKSLGYLNEEKVCVRIGFSQKTRLYLTRLQLFCNSESKLFLKRSFLFKFIRFFKRISGRSRNDYFEQYKSN